MPIALLGLLTNPNTWKWLGLGLAGALAASLALYIADLRGQRDAALARAASSHAAATVASGQAAVTQVAAAIADQGAQRAALDINLHEDNQHAIQAAPGASVALAPALNDAGRLGLCRYDAYAGDPACAGLRGDHPAVLPQAGGADAVAGR